MSELTTGDIVRLRVEATSAQQAAAFREVLTADPGSSVILTPMPASAEPQRQDFGTWELVQDFIVSAAGGASSVGIVEMLRGLWAHRGDPKQVPQAKETESQPLGPPPPDDSIKVKSTAPGIVEVTIRLSRD